MPSNAAALARAVMATGKALGLTLVAEGVERESQLAFMAQHGCQQWQGFLFSAPVDVATCDEFLRGEQGEDSLRCRHRIAQAHWKPCPYLGEDKRCQIHALS